MITQPISDIETLQSDGVDFEAAERMFKALASPIRLRILALLLAHGDTLCQREIEEALGWVRQQPTVSHHIRILREAGLIECTHKGKCKGEGKGNAIYQYHCVCFNAYSRVEAVVRQALFVISDEYKPAPVEPVDDLVLFPFVSAPPLRISNTDMRAALDGLYSGNVEAE